MTIPSLDQLMAYLPYAVAALSVYAAIAHRRGKEVPLVTALLDFLTMFKPSVTPVPMAPVGPPVAPNLPADHPVVRQLLDMLAELMKRTAPKQ